MANQDLHKHPIEAEPAAGEAKVGMKERKETAFAKDWFCFILPALIIFERIQFWALLF